MNFDWQNAMALIAVVAASGYLARRAWLALAHKRSGCGGCGSCPNSTATQPTIVTITLPGKMPYHAQWRAAQARSADRQ